MNYDVLLNLRSTLRGGNSSATTATPPSGDDSGGNNSALFGASTSTQRPLNLETSRIPRARSSPPAVKQTANDEIKGKLMSMWNNMKFGWSGVRTRTSFSKEQPVWLLGRCYHKRESLYEASTSMNIDLTETFEGQIPPEEPQPIRLNLGESTPVEELGLDVAAESSIPDERVLEEDEGIEGFRRDFITRIWMTYREKFPQMHDSNFTTDCGWGCMIRSGQMLLAEALVRHFLGRGWRYDPDSIIPTSSYEETMHRKIIKWFGDVKSKNCPFSIHNLVQIGKEIGKKPGDWYGPHSVSHVIKAALARATIETADLENLTVYVAQNCTIYIQDVYDECIIHDTASRAPWHEVSQSPKQMSRWKSVIVLVSIRLGTERLNQIYADCLTAMLSLDFCIGIIGGRPRHSLYFVGYQEDKLIHLDPHLVQESVDTLMDDFSVNSFHCKSPRKMKISKMDPSCCIGFYCKTKAEFDRFVATTKQFVTPCKNWMDKQYANHGRDYQGPDSSYVMFDFNNGRSKDDIDESRRVRSIPDDVMHQSAYSKDVADDDGIEEFVLL